MVNVTKTIPRKFKSNWREYVFGGKKCKEYDSFGAILDAGNVS